MMKIVLSLGCASLYALVFFSAPQDELGKSVQRGKALYEESCITCHLANGEGLKGTFPPLAKADFLIKYPEKAIHAIKFGMRGAVKVNGVDYNNAMPPSGFADDEIADVMNYIRNSFGNKNLTLVTEKQVAEIKEK
ncbi:MULTISPECIES: c-type cytochrome [Pedobacter]|uniref:c-type cytochrome n=1 Tax=Nubsella zeaxanthinifaciens TaxID=392412 RepID=UPI0018E511C3|nr:cytochrome c [Nubsella zeaxanthinifaciens]